MGRAASFTDPIENWDTCVLGSDDFLESVSTSKWTVQATDSGTATVVDGAKGILPLLPSDASVGNNDEIYVASAIATVLPAANRPFYGRLLMQYAEANTNDFNVLFGFMSSAVSAQNLLIDDGGGPRASGTLAVIYKVDGGTVWRCQSRNGSETTDTVTTATAGGSSYQLLEVYGDCNYSNGLKCQVTYKVDGNFLKDANGKVVVHTFLVAAATVMSLVFGCKNGSAGPVQTLNVDRVYGHQLRA
jgi:hypothetical protein